MTRSLRPLGAALAAMLTLLLGWSAMCYLAREARVAPP
jgi:hypothetical protein